MYKMMLFFMVIVVWGIYPLIQKEIVGRIGVGNTMMYSVIISLAFIPLHLLYMYQIENKSPVLDWKAVGLTLLVSALIFIANIGLLSLLKIADGGWVTIVTSVYPLVSLLVAYFYLHEPFTTKSIIGTIMVVIGVMLMF